MYRIIDNKSSGKTHQLMEIAKASNAVFVCSNPRAMEALRAPLFEEKVVSFVAERIKTTEKKMTPEELYAFDPDKK